MKLSFKKDKFAFLLPRIMEFVNSLEDDKEYELTVSKAVKKRSNDANRYFWELVGKLSEKINVSPEDIYRTYIRDIGGNYEVMPIKDEAVDTWKSIWRSRGIGWQCDVIGDSKLRGYKNVICYYGSSTYDTRQMSRLIDLCVQDCKSQGIETMTPTELASLMENYKEN